VIVTLQEQAGIKPYMFKAIVGRGHPEFSSSRQQDAQEFFLHLLTLIDRKQHSTVPGTANPTNCFKFQVSHAPGQLMAQPGLVP